MSDSTKPSTCTSEDWIWADNLTATNNIEGGENCGKWMIFEFHNTVDKVWDVIKQATEEGKLSFRAKVSTLKQKISGGDVNYVICIYTFDWTNEADVMRVREALRDLGFTKRMPYKSDADTLAGKYRATGHTRISKYYC